MTRLGSDIYHPRLTQWKSQVSSHLSLSLPGRKLRVAMVGPLSWNGCTVEQPKGVPQTCTRIYMTQQPFPSWSFGGCSCSISCREHQCIHWCISQGSGTEEERQADSHGSLICGPVVWSTRLVLVHDTSVSSSTQSRIKMSVTSVCQNKNSHLFDPSCWWLQF